MGGSYSSNSAQIAQQVTNTAIQTSRNVCNYQCGTENQNVTVIIVDSSNVTVDFSQTCSVVGTSCTVKNFFDTSITNILDAAVKQSVTNVSNFLQLNVSQQNLSISQNIRNNVAQLISNTCTNGAQTSNQNIYVFVGNAKNVDVNFAQSANISNANCAFDNTAKLAVFNQATAKADQSVTNLGLIGGILAALLLIAIIFALFIGVSFLKGRQNKGGSGNSDASAGEQLQAFQNAQNIKGGGGGGFGKGAGGFKPPPGGIP